MDEQDLVVLLRAEEKNSVSYYSSEIAKDQEKALEYYKGEPFGNEEEGKSSVISRDVSTTIDGIMPDLMRPFVSGDSVVEFEPTKPQDDAYADQATDYINYIFFRDNDGFEITHNWAKDGLMNKLGIVKAYWDDTKKQDRETYEGLTEEALTLLSQEAEIIEATPHEDTGLYDVTVMRTEDMGRVRIENVPPEEFLVTPTARRLVEADYSAHKCRKTKDDLIKMGFDKDTVMELASEDEDNTDGRALERYEDQGNDENRRNDKLMHRVWVLEEYIKVDFDGDGKTEFRKVTRVKNEILENVEVDEHPFIDFTPIRMPHQIHGKSLADDTMDIQLIKSTLLRQGMDNLYLTNAPRIEVPDSVSNEDTFDDLLTVRPGAPIRTKGMGGLIPITVPFTAANSFQMMEYWDGEKEERTGNTRLNQGLDADTLNKTATGVALIQNKGMGKIELIARNLANSFGLLFRKVLRLVVKFQDQQRIVQLRGTWTPIEPNMWNADMKVREQVGLGTGDRSERIQMRLQLLTLQQEGLQMGFVTPEHLYNNVAKLVRDMELGDADQYFSDPKAAQPPAPKPDPEMMKLQAEQQQKQAEMEMQKQKAQADIQIQREKNQASIQMEREKTALEQQLAREKAQFEAQLAERKLDFEEDLAMKRLSLDAAHKNAMTQNRPGGDLDK